MASNFDWDEYEEQEVAPKKVAASESIEDFPEVESAPVDWDDFDTVGSVVEGEADPTPIDDSMGMLQSGGLGALQGLSFDFADEIEGGARAAGLSILDAIKGKGSISDIPAKYKELIPEIRARYDKARTDNPASYMTGDIGAGLATGLLTGGASAVANIGKVGAKEGMKQLAKTGLKQGAVMGYGASEGKDLQEDLTNTAIGAGVGAGAGVLLPTAAKSAGKAVKAVGSKIGDLLPEFTQLGQEAYKLTRQGTKVVGREAKEILDKDTLSTAQELLNTFKKQYDKGSKMVGTALNTSEKGPMNVSRELKKLEGELKSSSMQPEDLDRIQKTLSQFKETFTKETVDPGLDKAVSKMEKMIIKAQSEASELGTDLKVSSPETKDGFLQALRKETTPEGDILPKVMQVDIPEDQIMKETFERWGSMSMQELQNLKKQMSELGFSKRLDGMGQSQAKKMSKELDSLIQSKMSPNMQGAYGRGNELMTKNHEAGGLFKELTPSNRFDKNLDIPLAEKISKSYRKTDNLTDRLGGLVDNQADPIIGNMKDIAVRNDLQKALSGEGTFFGGVKGTAVRLGASAGNITKKLADSGPSSVVGRLSKMGDAPLNNMANKMSQSSNQAVSEYGRRLSNAAADTGKRDRLLWALSQQPAFREIAHGMILEEEQNEEAVRGLEPPQPVQPKQTEAEELDSILFPNL